MAGRWKQYEREVARVLGGRRRPVTGIDRADGDVFTDTLEVQCKHRLGEPPPKRLLSWLDDMRAVAHLRARIGIVAWKRPGVGAAEESLVVLTLADFVRLVGRGAHDEEPAA